MKKLVPDPPYSLHTLPGLSGEEALGHAVEYLEKAITDLVCLPNPPLEQEMQMQMLTDALFNLRITKAMITVALAAKTLSVPI
ncbi:MAG: hypothetical protein LBJ37_18690 [Paucimonas sp.]|jgi:hypothetical protein|nr:hypothetical protein [Paucimonas sp.]